MEYRTLISTADSAARLADSDPVVVDSRYKLGDETWGEREWSASHVPGAAYLHLARDLSGQPDGTNGRHPLPDVARLAGTFGRLGISRGTTQVVAYDQDSGMFASRLWWLLRWLGHDAVAVLDGGFARWREENRPVSSLPPSHTACDFQPALRPHMAVGVGEVAARVGLEDWRLVDARAPERYRGDTEPLDRVAGHIPGAANHFYLTNLDERGTFRTADALRTQLDRELDDIPADHVVCYCGSGVTACHNLLALEHAGLSGAKLYPGSWSEWSSDPGRPIEKTRPTES